MNPVKHEEHIIYMQRALDLAVLGIGDVSPNPLVGCVIVHNGEIIGEGWHRKYGEGHAEVNAIDSVQDKSLLKKSIMYVTLEPCAHHGKTPPCAELIVESQIPEVVICNSDPFKQVKGKGVKILKKAGVKVTIGVMEDLGAWVNRRFFTSIIENRPYIILKWAQTSDGFIARSNFDSKWISGTTSRKLVHKWRAEEDAILVGYNTTLHDNPRLDCRDWKGKSPVRIYLDRDNTIPDSHTIKSGAVRTICYTAKIQSTNVNYEQVYVDFEEDLEWQILDDLHHQNIRSLIIEGGSVTLQKFIDQGLWDEARIFTADQSFEEGIQAPELLDAICNESHDIEGDSLQVWVRKPNEEVR